MPPIDASGRLSMKKHVQLKTQKMMKRLMILILLLLPLQYGKGQNLEQFFRTYHKEQGVDAIHIGNITMKLAGLFTETLGVNGIEILDFGEATETLRQRFQNEVKSFKDPEFETLLTENDKEDHTKILVKIKDEIIRELVIFQTGSDCSFIRIKGKIKPSDIERVINEQEKDGN